MGLVLCDAVFGGPPSLLPSLPPTSYLEDEDPPRPDDDNDGLRATTTALAIRNQCLGASPLDICLLFFLFLRVAGRLVLTSQGNSASHPKRRPALVRGAHPHRPARTEAYSKSCCQRCRDARVGSTLVADTLPGARVFDHGGSDAGQACVGG